MIQFTPQDLTSLLFSGWNLPNFHLQNSEFIDIFKTKPTGKIWTQKSPGAAANAIR